MDNETHEIKSSDNFDEENGTHIQNKYAFWYHRRGGKSAAHSVNYEESMKQLASFQTIEHFWNIYNHMVRPGDIKGTTDYHLFKDGIKPTWEDSANANGGKWMVRLKKGLASLLWEEIVLSVIGEQFDVGHEICGAVVSVRNGEDIISVWNKTADNQEATNKIRDHMRRVMRLPPYVVIEYKKHVDSLADKSSFRNPTLVWKPTKDHNKDTQRGEGGHYNKEGGHYNKEGGHYNKEGGHYNKEGGHYNKEGGHYNKEGGHYNKEGGHYNKEGGHYNKEGGHYNKEGGHYNKEGGHYNKEHNKDDSTGNRDSSGRSGGWSKPPNREGTGVTTDGTVNKQSSWSSRDKPNNTTGAPGVGEYGWSSRSKKSFDEPTSTAQGNTSNTTEWKATEKKAAASESVWSRRTTSSGSSGAGEQKGNNSHE